MAKHYKVHPIDGGRPIAEINKVRDKFVVTFYCYSPSVTSEQLDAISRFMKGLERQKENCNCPCECSECVCDDQEAFGAWHKAEFGGDK